MRLLPPASRPRPRGAPRRGACCPSAPLWAAPPYCRLNAARGTPYTCLSMGKGVPSPRNTVAEPTRTAFKRFLRAVQGWSLAKAHHGRYGRTGDKHQNTQETGRGSIDQVATGWPASPRGHMSDETLHLFICYFLCLFVYLLRCLFVVCYNVAINPPKESRNAPC